MTSDVQYLAKREAEALVPRFKFERLLNQGMLSPPTVCLPTN